MMVIILFIFIKDKKITVIITNTYAYNLMWPNDMVI